MQKLTRTAAARLAGVSLYRLNKDIASGQLTLTRAGGINRQSLYRRYPQARPAAESAAGPADPIEHEPGTLDDVPAVAEAHRVDPEPLPAPPESALADPALLRRIEQLLGLLREQRALIGAQRRQLALMQHAAVCHEDKVRRLRNRVAALESVPDAPWQHWVEQLQQLGQGTAEQLSRRAVSVAESVRVSLRG